MNLSKELIIYCFNKKSKIFLLLISSIQGWGIFQIKYSYILVKEKKIYLYNSISLIKTYFFLLSSFLLGLFKIYFQYLKLKGMGFKAVVISFGLLLKLGYSHRVLYIFLNDLKFSYIHKQLLQIESRCLYKLKNLFYKFQKIRKSSVYKKKGIFLKGVILKVKVSTKKV